MSTEMLVNELPSPTWRWLRMNGTTVSNVPALHNGEYTKTVPEGVAVTKTPRKDIEKIATAVGSDLDKVLDAAMDQADTFTATSKVEDPVRLGFDYDSDSDQAESFMLEAGDDASLTVIMNFDGGRGNGTAAVQTRYRAGRNAKIRLIQVQTLGSDFRFFNDIGGECAENGRFELVQLILNGKETYTGSRTELNGQGSTLGIDVAYLAGHDEKLDMNYISNHYGKKTDCLINADGVLRSNAHKLFRGTIDFKRGCAGSTGNEKESILLMDDDVVNQTLPVILCTEEDVEGNHGASIGKLDQETEFYMMSRGIPKEEVLELMARARVDRVRNLIDDKETRDHIDDFMSKLEEKRA